MRARVTEVGTSLVVRWTGSLDRRRRLPHARPPREARATSIRPWRVSPVRSALARLIPCAAGGFRQRRTGGAGATRRTGRDAWGRFGGQHPGAYSVLQPLAQMYVAWSLTLGRASAPT